MEIRRNNDLQAEILTSSGCLVETTAGLRGILRQETLCAVAEGDSALEVA